MLTYFCQNVIISEHHQSDTYVNKLGPDITHTHTFILFPFSEHG
jgi:hypothetical protein